MTDITQPQLDSEQPDTIQEQDSAAQRGLLIRAALVLLGALGILVGYYWVHKPLDAALALNLGGALLDLATVGALLIAAGAVGRRLVTWIAGRLALDLTTLSAAERLALPTLIGLGAIATVVLLLGLAGFFSGLVFWPLLLIAGIVLRRDLRAWLAEAAALIRSLRVESVWVGFLIALSGLLLITALLHALAPPYAWDGLTYHLIGPQFYLDAGRLLPHPDNFYLGFPKAVEMLSGVTMSLFGRDTTPALIHYSFGVLGLLAVGGMTRRYAHVAAGWLAVALLLASFNFWELLAWPYVDMAVLAYAALAFAIVTRWRESLQPGWLVILGVLLGLAVGVKFTSGIVAVAVGLLVIVRQPRRWFRNGLILAGIALIVFSPWLLRGWLHYDNPIYPYLFDGLNWDATRSHVFNQVGQGMISRGEVWQLALLPLTATIIGTNFGPTFAFTLGPWLLTAPLLLFAVWRWVPGPSRSVAVDGALLLLPMFIFWGVTASVNGIAMQTRLMIAVLPLSAVLGGIALYAVTKWPEKPLDLKFIVRALLVLTFVLSGLDTLVRFVNLQVVPTLVGQVSADEYRFRQFAGYGGTMDALGTVVPAGSQVRFLFEPRGYLCPSAITCRADVLFDFWGYPYDRGQSADAIFAEWRAQGDDYVFIFDWGYQFYVEFINYFPAANAALPDALATLPAVWATDDERYTLYALNPPAADQP
ncbi:MAG: hypothetical protein GYB67_17525 [Chloroflexi bacterium]|nr:hypothetical protein [Chloroflexota bacterium]